MNPTNSSRQLQPFLLVEPKEVRYKSRRLERDREHPRSRRKLNEIMEELILQIRSALNHRDGGTIYRSVLKRTIAWVFLSSDSGSL